jgi:ketosteroid isomerase-like protein
MENSYNMRRTRIIVIVSISLIASIPSQTQIKDISDIDAVKQLEQTLGSAMVAGDIGRLKQIYADDFATILSDGKVVTKDGFLSAFESSRNKLESFENGPVDVQVFGDVALAQGVAKQKREGNGKHGRGLLLWQDVLHKRGGNWVVWRSASAKVVSADAANALPRNPAALAAIKKFEDDLGNAMVTNNIKKINRAYADDWATIASSGEKFTKNGLLQDFKSGNHKLIAFENGPMNVQILADIALVQTSVTEKRIQDGKDISGKFVFMDLLKRREGQWVIVRSLATSPG